MGATKMKNKEKLKSAIEQDINPKNYYNEIIKKVEKEDEMKKKNYIWQWSLVSTCLVAVISGILLVNSNKELKPNIYQPNMDAKDTINMYINDVNNVSQGALRIDADIKVTTIENTPYFKELDTIKVPSDFDNHEVQEIYVKSDRESNKYNVLQCYVFNYSNTKKDRHIRISLSQKNKPVRDYSFSEEGSKLSKINNIELKVFKYNELYFTEFCYKGINFDIETTNITEQELTSLLSSILK